MTISEILAAKLAYQRMHPDRIKYAGAKWFPGNARDRRRQLRRLILRNPAPDVQIISSGFLPENKGRFVIRIPS